MTNTYFDMGDTIDVSLLLTAVGIDLEGYEVIAETDRSVVYTNFTTVLVVTSEYQKAFIWAYFDILYTFQDISVTLDNDELAHVFVYTVPFLVTPEGEEIAIVDSLINEVECIGMWSLKVPDESMFWDHKPTHEIMVKFNDFMCGVENYIPYDEFSDALYENFLIHPNGGVFPFDIIFWFGPDLVDYEVKCVQSISDAIHLIPEFEKDEALCVTNGK